MAHLAQFSPWAQGGGSAGAHLEGGVLVPPSQAGTGPALAAGAPHCSESPSALVVTCVVALQDEGDPPGPQGWGQSILSSLYFFN